MTRLLAGTVAAALALAAVAAAAYGPQAGIGVAKILLPVGVVTVLVAALVSARRARMGGLRRQMAAIAVVALAQMAVAVTLFVGSMFVSRHDAFFAILVVAYGALLVLCVAGQLSARALADVNAIREGLRRVGDGARDVQIAVSGGGELAAVAADVEAMVARLGTEEHARRRLIASVSHDLRTPITTLQLMTEAIEDQIVEPAVRDRYVAQMTVHVRALSSLIADLFELSRLEAGDITWSLERVRVDELVQETVDAMRPHADAEAIRMRAEPSAPLMVARANPEQIQRVLFNLIQNALRHTPRDGSVVVRAEARPRAVEVEVADTGEGIRRGDRQRVFEPFTQGEGREARTDGSAGLGLAIARAIVEAHGGRIWLEDAAVGTRVRFSLPSV